MKKLTESQINEKIKHKKSTIDYSTYIDNHKLARFIDFEYGSYLASPLKVIHRTKKHPIRSDIERRQKLRKYKTINEINEILEKTNRQCRLISSFSSMSEKVEFIDFEYGKFKTTIESVLLGHDQWDRGRKKLEEAVKKKYGVSWYSQHKDFKEKVKKTFIEKCGYEHNMKCPELSLKNARSQNKSFVHCNWEDKSECICVGSYEKSVIDYLNKNQIRFRWQPKTFDLGNSQTYRPDLYLIDQDLWIEIKGYMRKDAEIKWNQFHASITNSELWDKEKLKQLGIQFNRKGMARYGKDT